MADKIGAPNPLADGSYAANNESVFRLPLKANPCAGDLICLDVRG